MRFGAWIRSFWTSPTGPDEDLFERFRSYLIGMTQVSGSFYSGRRIVLGDPELVQEEGPQVAQPEPGWAMPQPDGLVFRQTAPVVPPHAAVVVALRSAEPAPRRIVARMHGGREVGGLRAALRSDTVA